EIAKGFIYELESVIEQRIGSNAEGSYTSRLFNSGVNKVAQKVGEEAVELVIEAKDNNIDLFKNEAADLLYHFLILLKTKSLKLEDIEAVLQGRHR
ncbi:MAG: phosphoribosyl-ATP diphosphatase, partial [Petrimonas mucosa]